MKRSALAGRFEAGFDMLYLAAAFIMGCLLLIFTKSSVQTLFGVAALVLVAGDAFHLVPRIGAALSQKTERWQHALGIGKEITSIGMTLFYVVLWHIGLVRFAPDGVSGWTIVVYVLAAVRIVLCLFPQNGWTQKNPSLAWAVWRNIPFTLLGILVAVLFFIFRGVAFTWMALAILLSFAFYIPVVLWADRHPMLGMLMLPKTLCYVWIIAMGFTAFAVGA